MLGSGNVGLVVSYQLMQAGCEVVALADAAPRVGGYLLDSEEETVISCPHFSINFFWRSFNVITFRCSCIHRSYWR